MKLSEQELENLRRLQNSGLTVNQIFKIQGLSYSTVYFYLVLEPKGFKDYTEYKKFLARKKGFNSRSEAREQWAKDKGYESYQDYQDKLAQKQGHANYSEQRKEWFKGRQDQKRYQEFATLITIRLKELDKRQSWLAKKLGKSREIISKYAKALALPKEEGLRRRIADVLEIQYETIEKIIEQPNVISEL